MPYALPLVNSAKHPDLKAISADTVCSISCNSYCSCTLWGI